MKKIIVKSYMMKEKEYKYMGHTLKYKEAIVPNMTDNYGMPLVFKVARQSNAEQVVDKDTGAISWSAGNFFDYFIKVYIADEEYENLDDEKIIELANNKKAHKN